MYYIPPPIKSVQVKTIIQQHDFGLKVTIDDKEFIGTGYFFFRQDEAPPEFINQVNSLADIRTVEKNTFKECADYDSYNYSDELAKYGTCISTDSTPYIVFGAGLGAIMINHDYYSYFKNLGVEFRLKPYPEPVGMFKDKQFVGLIAPVNPGPVISRKKF